MKVHEVGELRDSDGKAIGPAVLITGDMNEIRKVGALLWRQVRVVAVEPEPLPPLIKVKP